MENTNQEKKGRKGFWRGLALVAVTVGVCYEIFGRKGQDVKKAAGWVKNKVGKKQETQPEQTQNNRQNNGGGWNNNRRN